jgi:uncharacterized protein YuzE
MSSIISLWYDKEGDFLEITFRNAKGYFQEIADDIYERVDEHGNLLGYAIFNMSQHERQSLMIHPTRYLKTACKLSSGE